MPTRAGESRGGLGGAAKVVSERASAIVRLELQLAAAELKRKLAELGVGIGLLVGAALFALYALGFGLATIAAGLATTLSVWLALLIVTGALFLIVAILALIGYSRVQKGTPPVPEQAIEEAKLTTEALKNGSH
jgi:Putative Actinobacterial Holin-X, holin superfamily III